MIVLEADLVLVDRLEEAKGVSGRSTYMFPDVLSTVRIALRWDVKSAMSIALSAPKMSTAPAGPLRGPSHSSASASLERQKKVILYPLLSEGRFSVLGRMSWFLKSSDGQYVRTKDHSSILL